MKDYFSLIENGLEYYLNNANMRPLLSDSVRYSLMNAGKRIRPYICLLVADMISDSAEAAVPYACAIEMIHTYSLIHDDLPAMDNDDMRRGKPSNHIVFGEGNAILAGDALLSLAASVLVKTDNSLAASAVTDGAVQMLNGQSMDINETVLDETGLIEMYDGKTGGLFAACVLSGFYAAGGRPEDAEKWKRFGLDLGRLFQITDDILDRQKDMEEHKFTYLSLHSDEEACKFCESVTASLIRFLETYRNAASDRLTELIRSIPNRKK